MLFKTEISVMIKGIFLLAGILGCSNYVFSQQPIHIKLSRYKVAQLPVEVEETSGLCLLDGKLYTLNDSGNSSDIFSLNPQTGEITEKISVPVKNIDFEAIACTPDGFYIGDFGNNNGSREDLAVYHIGHSAGAAVMTPFAYAQQKDFTSRPINNDWDAESLAIIDGKVNIFSKEWFSKNVRRYILEKKGSEKVSPLPIESFPLGFVATDAAFYDNKLYLVGYTKKLEVFMSVFSRDDLGNFFSGRPKKYFLGMSTGIGQIEGIAVNERGIFISGERFKLGPFNHPQSLYFIPANEFSDKK